MNRQRTGVYVTRVTPLGLAVLGSFCAPGHAAAAVDPEAGKALFQQQCTVCHTAEPNDNGGAQGPSLQGVFGRKAGGDPSFGYTQALKDAKVTWNEPSLKRFLAGPSQMVPGTAMAVSIADPQQRSNVVAYLKWIKLHPPAAAAKPAAPAPATTSESDWKKDAPGRAHKIDLAALPAPFATASARNNPKLVPRPAYAQLSVPKGFKVGLFAKDLEGPRKILVAPGGELFVTETRGGRVSVLHPAADGRSSEKTDVFADGLDKPFGIAFYPSAQDPKWLYIAENNRIIRFAFKKGDVKASGAPEVVVPQLTSSGGGHSTRDIAFSADGRRLYVSVGSQSNVAESMSKKSPEQVKQWESAHGLGATWDQEENRAAVLVFDVDSKGPGKVFASGIRNCVSLTMQANNLWCTTNERDLLGDDLVPDYSTRVPEGSFFGWPWYYMGAHEDPRLKGDRPDLKNKVSVPDVPYQAHSAALGLVFYTATAGKSAFPAEYVGDGFAMLHGSWNRGFRTGHKVVRVRMKDGVPTGEYDDFLTGFIIDDGDAWGRPVSGAVLADGSLLVSDDGGNVIYRVSYEP